MLAPRLLILRLVAYVDRTLDKSNKLCKNVYQIYQMRQQVENGEMTQSDVHWDKYGLDSGFRSVTKGQPPACGEDCLFSDWFRKM